MNLKHILFAPFKASPAVPLLALWLSLRWEPVAKTTRSPATRQAPPLGRRQRADPLRTPPDDGCPRYRPPHCRPGNNTADQSADFLFDGSIWDLGTKKMKWTTLHNTATQAKADKLNFYATAPIPAPTTATSVEADQSSTANYINSDLLVAFKSVNKGATAKYDALPITLKHVLAKLTIEINAKALGEGATISKVTIKDAITAYTTKYSPASGTPAATTADGSDKKDVTPLPVNNSVYTAILPAQAIQETNGITINIATGDGQSFTYQPTDAINLLQGKNTTLKLRLAGEGVILGTVNVTEWEDGTTTEGNINADTPNVP